MKIIAPVKTKQYAEKLIMAGADELYGGVLDEAWQDRFGQFIEYNRRGSYGGKANISGWEELREILDCCRENDVRFFLTANALRIAGEQRPMYFAVMERFRQIGGEHVIVSDPSVIRQLLRMGLRCTVSSCSGVRNPYAAAYYRDLGCERIIFPRDLTMREIAEISDAVQGVEYEAFLSNSGCKFLDGNCLGLHGIAEGALCDYCSRREWEFYRRDGVITPEETEILRKNHDRYYRLLRHACAQCMLYDLSSCVDSVKIVGRVAGEEGIVKDVALTRQNLQIAEEASSRRSYLQRRVRSSEEDAMCRDHLNCYYRTDMLNRQAAEEELENSYQSFLRQQRDPELSSKLDYIGINLTETDPRRPIQYKLYYNTKASLEASHPLVEEFRSRDMLRAVTRIRDTADGGSDRYDMGLQNRTRQNIDAALRRMEEHAPYLTDTLPLIRRLGEMRVSTDPERDSSALYFLGFIERAGEIAAVKPHFLTRRCRDPDRIDTLDIYDDAYYLKCVRETGESAFLDIVPVVSRVLEADGAHLWMVGVDVFKDKPGKYKIYIKYKGLEILRLLRDALSRERAVHRELIDRLELLECWLGNHTELRSEGVAVSRDSGGRWCFNLYLCWI